MLAIVAGVVGVRVPGVAVALAVGTISLAGASRSCVVKIGVWGVGADAIAVAGVMSDKSQGLGSIGCAVAVAVCNVLDEVSTTKRGKGSCWSKTGVLEVGGNVAVIDKLDSTNCWRSQKENL